MFEFFAMMVLIEHAMILLKLGIAVLIPDQPDWIAEDKFRQDIYDNQSTEKLDQQLNTVMTDYVDSHPNIGFEEPGALASVAPQTQDGGILNAIYGNPVTNLENKQPGEQGTENPQKPSNPPPLAPQANPSSENIMQDALVNQNLMNNTDV